MKVHSYSIKEFMNKKEAKPKVNKGKVITGTICLTTAFLLVPDQVAEASTGIDASARNIYSKLLNVGKWIIIIKGGIDTINNSVKGDFDSAKKSFLSYLIVYLVLNALPWAMDEVDNVFRQM